MKVGVIGAGSWGTALAKVAALNGHQTVLWGRSARTISEIRNEHRNTRYLPATELPESLDAVTDIAHCLEGASLVVLATPSKTIRAMTEQIAPYVDRNTSLVCVAKGIELETGMLMSEIVEEALSLSAVAGFSGPTLAHEVANERPAAIVAASRLPEISGLVQKIFHRPAFRVYTSDDLTGVELGGALKNVIAIAAGACDGFGFGVNTKAALVTRGIAEISRLGVERGAQEKTFSGLSGLGDLMLTCFAETSRNRSFGQYLGSGLSLERALTERNVTIEGYPNAASARKLAQQANIVTPIIEEVYQVLYKQKDIREAVNALLMRDARSETD